ncbi:MAG: DUF58 domain-containing protein [Litorilituus sp.]|nr:DUF58 domain-containing protein [Litorilituus sp.]
MFNKTAKKPNTACPKKSPLWQLTLTKFGVMWLVVSIIFFILAANYSNNLLLFIALLFIAVFINSPWLTWLNIRKISSQMLTIEPVYAQQTAAVKVQVNNPEGKHTSGLSVSLNSSTLTNNQGFKKNHKAKLTSTTLPLSKDKITTTAIAITPFFRGCFTLNGIQLNCTYPLGLWRWQKKTHNESKLWVYPTPQGQLPLPKPQAKQGTYLKREQGDFSHIRTYQRGDSLNHIAWKQMARTGEVMTKEFDGGEGLKQTVLSYHSIKQGSLDSRLNQLCRWIVDCHQKQVKYALELPNQTIPAAQGEAHKEVCLQALAQFGLTLPSETKPE